MKIRTFIDRPILAGVISVLILILGSSPASDWSACCSPMRGGIPARAVT